MPRGRLKGSKNKRPYPLSVEQVRERNRGAVARAKQVIRARGYTGASPNYIAVHKAALRWIPRDQCAKSDDECAGRLEHALRMDADPALVVREPEGKRRAFYIGNIHDGYRVLCRVHHQRETDLHNGGRRAHA